MARIAGIDLPRNKNVEIALTYIHGIGRSTARRILQQAPGCFGPQRNQFGRRGAPIREAIDQSNLKIEGDLQRDVSTNIKRLMDLGTYRGLRHGAASRCAANARTPIPAPVRAPGVRSEGKNKEEECRP